MRDLLLVTGLAVIACSAPLCTLASLWQLKEWRWDRLREELRAGGVIRLLFGVQRPVVLILLLLLEAVSLLPQGSWPLLPLGVFAAMTLLQAALRRQPLPVWTQKARVLTATALSVDALLALLLAQSGAPAARAILGALPLLQSIVLSAAWLLWYPVDVALKHRIFRKASVLRAHHPQCTVIGITGSVGKTTTKDLLAHLLGNRAAATPAHVNSEMGVARWLLQTLTGSTVPEVLVVEMGAYRRGEIARLCAMTKPRMGIITFIGTQHIALFGSQQALLEAKSELVDALPTDGTAILNADSPFFREIRVRCPCPVRTVGTGGTSDLTARDIQETPFGVRFTVNGTVFAAPLHGTHNVANILLAIHAAELLGVPRAEVAARLQTFRPQAHTFTVHVRSGVTVLDDTHNASPASMEAAIAWAKDRPERPRVLLTPGIIEQGASTAMVHRKLGVLAKGVFDRVIFLHGSTARMFANGFGAPVEVFHPVTTARIPSGSLLVCVGRMPSTAMDALLPHTEPPIAPS